MFCLQVGKQNGNLILAFAMFVLTCMDEVLFYRSFFFRVKLCAIVLKSVGVYYNTNISFIESSYIYIGEVCTVKYRPLTNHVCGQISVTASWF